ncbi:hypothetical protein [Marinicella meishanensis]|uniref:hypothetical protein n=1 Tax=Marinicella meishanensis TaxID=2873263 RepID=UPI001CBC399A|nr:hypothetical protein [Marinicella sp. NBU2979]
MWLVLTGCQPKGTTLYQHDQPENHPIEHTMVVIDYLNLRDDLGRYWDFDSYYHEDMLNRLLAAVDMSLQKAGYPAASGYLLTSGLLVDEGFAVEHYIQETLQPELLYAPFIMASDQIPDDHIDQHRDVMRLMIKYLAPKRHHASDPNSHRGMQMGYHFSDIDLPPNTGILYLHVDLSATGAIKQLGTLILSGAVASQSDYASMHLDLGYRRHASAFWVHTGSGQILWKNHSNQWTPAQPIGELLLQFPPNTAD